MKSGFTLIEMIVAIALFLVLIIAVSQIFLSVVLVQQKTLDEHRTVQDLQYNLEQMAQEIRLGKIYFEHYSLPLVSAVDDLFLINGDTRIIFKKDSSICQPPSENCLVRNVDGVETVISSPDIDIEKLNFYISPPDSPYRFDEKEAKYKSDKQPVVTILLAGTAVKGEKQKTISLQTSITSRYYER